MKERLTMARPPWLRRLSFRLKHRGPTPRLEILQDRHVGRIIDLGFPYMRKFFDVAKVFHHGQYGRLCTLEYLLQAYNAADSGGK
jgi:hypothetical protein